MPRKTTHEKTRERDHAPRRKTLYLRNVRCTEPRRDTDVPKRSYKAPLDVLLDHQYNPLPIRAYRCKCGYFHATSQPERRGDR